MLAHLLRSLGVEITKLGFATVDGHGHIGVFRIIVFTHESKLVSNGEIGNVRLPLTKCYPSDLGEETLTGR